MTRLEGLTANKDIVSCVLDPVMPFIVINSPMSATLVIGFCSKGGNVNQR